MNEPESAPRLGKERGWVERVRDEYRVVFEASSHVVSRRSLLQLPAGDGHPVLVLPAYSVSDRATWPLRSVLRELGYDARGWGLGKNRGADRETVEGVRSKFIALHRSTGQRVSVVGWSLGGVMARGLGRKYPESARRVITLGSPYRAIEAARGWPSPPVPTTSIYSCGDALVPWENASEEEGPLSENVQVSSTHSGLALNPVVVRAVAERLRLPGR